jgi:D-alanyl-lipoteichoic acid acyltransferase DltB (MBOAT superfamily)
VFLVSGFWHGANWTFIMWGALHGFYIVYALATKKYRENINNKLGISKIHWLNNTINVITTFILVTYAWIFFRANNINDAFFISRRLCNIPSELWHVLVTRKIAFLHLPAIYLILRCCYAILFLEITHLISLRFDLLHNFNRIPKPVRWAIYYGGMIATFYLGVFEKHQFIYFQF